MAEGDTPAVRPGASQPAISDGSPSDSTSHPQNQTSDSPETVQRAMRKMAEGAPEGLTEITAMMGGMIGHPLHQKMNEAHITKMLDLAVQHDTNEYDLKKGQQTIDAGQEKSNRWFHLAYFVLFISLVVFIIVMFRNQPVVLVPILTGVGGVVTGFLGGVGYAKTIQSKSKSD